ncbi:hypothetical protein MVLG_06268 [Microbotryum lychnidis-dioicae p1A1 Lamole]|uniref:Protein disulfide-isomerase n=1 Tax=Microbotryum lychnidis-dioicae (strain p1A1 Lamole / MvSl-1064) TaxID=683840 RepID=U5HGR4_USTV1|nr:hypothetical protein MVLG_06268 [Microbotryum lychnidis-dioicae p1A1 Lamole]|eukprot:KDE03239.1 hypothetical protein MVLG_06268 [Microbotryum lychnidis-dioicae p1A1 Lamole]
MRFSLLVTAALYAAARASSVIDLTTANFDEVAKGDLSLIEFFAPWCGHCKALAPHYDEASDILAKHGVVLAKVDCTVEAELCTSHDVSGYPTLKVFRKGESSDYGGSRKTDGIVSHMKKQLLPTISDVTASTHDEFSKADKLVFIAYIAEDDKTSKEVFTAFAESHRDDYLFGLSHDAEKVAGVTPPAVVLYKTFDEGRNDFTDKLSSQALDAFAKEHTVPILDEISPNNFAMYAEAGIPLAYIFIPDDHKKRSEITKSIEPIAREHKGKINFVWIDANKFADHAKSLNLLEPTWPSFAIQNLQEMTKFPLDQSKPVDHKTISAFVQDFLGGKIAASIKSEKVPASQDEPVFVLVADQFEEVVADKSKDLLVEFYAPWCGHCKKLKPTWDELGQKYAGAKSKVTIAKFDATGNDVPASAGFRVLGFPTIKLRAANTNEWISYEGDRTLESLVEFLESNATNDISAADEPAVAGGAASEQTVIADHHDEL